MTGVRLVWTGVEGRSVRRHNDKSKDDDESVT